MRPLFFITLLLGLHSCGDKTSQNVLYIEKDRHGRISKEVREGFEYGEGSFRRTTFFDTLGRKKKVLEVKDNNKIVETFEYSDSLTYEFTYYDLGHTESYTDSSFTATEKDIVFVRHVRLNSKGIAIYEHQKWLGDSIHCQERVYDSLGKEISFKKTNCR